MRPVGIRRLLQSKVAAEAMAPPRVRVSNLLAPTEQSKIKPDWGDWAGSGGSGGCRNRSFAPEPFSGAA